MSEPYWVPLGVSAEPHEGPVGPQGPPGPTGQAEQWLYGTGAPSDAGGANGDFYLQNTGQVWEKQAGTWIFTGINLSGPQGIQGIQGPAGPANPWQMGQTWSVLGALNAGALPGIFVPKLTSQTITLKGIRAKILSGTSIVAQCRRNGTNLGSAITITTTAATTAFSQVLADGDGIDFVLSTPTGSPADLSLTAFLEHLAA